MGKAPVGTLNSIEGKSYTIDGKSYTMVDNCGMTHGSCCRGNDHDPNLDAVGNARMAFVGTDVGLRGTADDGIRYDRGLGANYYASCHNTHTVNTHIVPAHMRYQIMPSKRQQLWLEKHCETYHYSH